MAVSKELSGAVWALLECVHHRAGRCPPASDMECKPCRALRAIQAHGVEAIAEAGRLSAGERVCRDCRWLDDKDRCQMIWTCSNPRTGDDLIGFRQRHGPAERATVEIDSPGEFGCVKWEKVDG